MGKIKEFLNEMSKFDRKPSLAMSKIIAASSHLGAAKNKSIIDQLNDIKSKVEQVKREAKGLDHKTAKGLDDALNNLSKLALIFRDEK